ncbi:hypothetical protein ABZ611_30895 [Streptomyces sp. NPDC007861]|uniref:hypothetical protein n=1 Tax=Streptomyces sp. NPDC007861 TaxID=3154893 RepID=UPI0033F775D2
MTATPLIVPMSVDALLANEASAPDITTTRPDWKRLRSHAPAEFTGDSYSPYNSHATGNARFDHAQMGIFLQWELPAALRTAHTDPNDPTAPADFPKVPNRWLVLRHHRQHSNANDTAKVRGWFIRSDIEAAEDDVEAAILPVKDETGTSDAEEETETLVEESDTSSGYPTNKWYGYVYSLDDDEIPTEEDAGATEKQFLTAGSLPLPAFTQYQPYNQNIFSFHDTWNSLTTAQANLNANELTVSYLVVGWYSDTDSDPVQSTGKSKLPSLLQDLGWEVEGDLPDVAEHSLYVGTVMSMPWHAALDPSDRSNYTYKYKSISAGGTEEEKEVRLDGRPSVLEVARPVIAHSSVEAQAAYLSLQKQELNDYEAALFEAFQYHLLDDNPIVDNPKHNLEPLADYALGFTRHDFSFSSTAGGIIWHLIPAETTSSLQVLEDRHIENLNNLNAAQAAYDKYSLQMRDRVTRLKGLWWIASPEDEDTKTKMGALAADISTCLSGMVEQRQKIPSGKTTDELAANIKTWADVNAPSGYELRPVPRPAFRKVNNPVVMLTGLQDPQRTAEIDGYLGGFLSVRPASKLATGQGLILSGKAQENYSSTDVVPARIAGPLAALYDEFNKLEETAFKNPRSKEAYRPLREVLKEKTPNSYIPPYTRWWRQPWRPTFMEWEAKIYPTQITQTPHYAFTQDTESGRFEYIHKPNTAIDVGNNKPKEVSGNTWIAPIIESHTLHRLEYTKTTDLDFGSDEYQNLINHIKQNNWDMLSFTLAGINETLAGRRTDIGIPTRMGDGTDIAFSLPEDDPGYNLPPAALTATVPHLPLFPPDDDEHPDDLKARGEGDFATFPAAARSAQFCLTKLTIIDSFGRTLKLLADPEKQTVTTSPNFQVRPTTLSYKPDSKNTEINASRLIELPPRLHQGARLLFEHLDKHGQSAAPTTNPVHAWLMPTRFGQRRALLCYTPVGEPLFEIYCTHEGVPRSRSLPYSDYTDVGESAFSTSHPQLAKFLEPLLKTPSGSTPLQELLRSLDISLTTIAPPTPRGPDSNLATLLMGRPCALVTARLRLELDGPPLPEPTIDGLTGTKSTTPTKKWPVRLGDPDLIHDGFLGYFSDDYTHFHTYHRETTDKYTVAIAPEDFTLTPQDATDPKPADDLAVPLLTCPAYPVHATTDILPVTQLALPTTVIDHALSAIRPAFPVGPVLTTVKDDPNAPLTMPIPTLGTDQGTWVWAQPPDWRPLPLNPPQPTDQCPVLRTEARTGFLVLSPKPQTAK